VEVKYGKMTMAEVGSGKIKAECWYDENGIYYMQEYPDGKPEEEKLPRLDRFLQQQQNNC